MIINRAFGGVSFFITRKEGANKRGKCGREAHLKSLHKNTGWRDDRGTSDIRKMAFGGVILWMTRTEGANRIEERGEGGRRRHT